MLIFALYIFGLLAIGAVAAMMAKACSEKEMSKKVVIWGCWMASIWLFWGVLMTFVYLAKLK